MNLHQVRVLKYLTSWMAMSVAWKPTGTAAAVLLLVVTGIGDALCASARVPSHAYPGWGYLWPLAAAWGGALASYRSVRWLPRPT